MPASVEHVHLVRVRRGAPERVDAAVLKAGRGIAGDHHDRSGIKRAVTLIRAETMDAVAGHFGQTIAPGASRRNLTIRGIDLDSLPRGTRLRVGEAELELAGPCDPCQRMETALGPGARAFLEGRGGVIAKIIRGGTVRPGDVVEPVEGDRARDMQLRLLDWFDRHRRDLPWRRTKDPYAIWLSEIMCQQTQVATAVPYWERFLARFPDVGALAAAPLDDVLALWSGLGYYARARNLHLAAKAVVEQHGGSFPSSLEGLLSLPGFGPYTAGAVGSIAMGLDTPLVDGNVARVLCRLEGWELGAEAAREKAWEIAPELVAKGRAGDWNQALMELGATVCTPASPACDGCPLRPHCAAARRGEPAKYPLPKERRPRKLLRFAALAIRDGEAVLLVRRADKGLFGGMWELPSIEVDAGSGEAAVRALARDLGTRRSPERVGAVAQALTHRDVQVDVFTVVASLQELPEGGRWVLPDELPTLGLSTLAVKTLLAAHVQVPAGHGRRKSAPSPRQRTLFG